MSKWQVDTHTATGEEGAKFCYGSVERIQQELWPIAIPPLQSMELIDHHPVHSCCDLHFTSTMKMGAQLSSETSPTQSPPPAGPHTPNHGWCWPSINVRASNFPWQPFGHTQNQSMVLVIRHLTGCLMILIHFEVTYKVEGVWNHFLFFTVENCVALKLLVVVTFILLLLLLLLFFFI